MSGATPAAIAACDLTLDVGVSGRGASGRGGMRVLEHVSLAVPAGQFVAVVGPSGCGKSTLLRVLSGLLPPTGGEVRVNGHPVGDARDRVGFMFQKDTLLPWSTVAENIRVGAELAGLRGSEADHRVAALVRLMRLDSFENHRPHSLSGGMRQRVSLGRLLAFDPDIFLMDEPFGALDPQTKIAMGRELQRLWLDQPRPVVFVTHDIEEAVLLSDRVVVLSARPAQIALDLPVLLERPRDARALRRDPTFARHVDEVWSMLDAVSPAAQAGETF